jgi:hypothetical protein
VALARLPYLELLEPGRWGLKFKFQEYKRLQIAGGPVKPPQTEFERRIAAAQKELGQATANADAALAAARAARGERAKRNPHVGP